MQRLNPEFKEVAVKGYSLTNKFGIECTIKGVTYPQGVGPNKKVAKTDAAQKALNIILGIQSFEDYGQGNNTVLSLLEHGTP